MLSCDPEIVAFNERFTRLNVMPMSPDLAVYRFPIGINLYISQ